MKMLLKIKSMILFVFLIFLLSKPAESQNLQYVFSLIDSLKYDQAVLELNKIMKTDKKNPALYHLKGQIFTFRSINKEKSDPEGIFFRREAEEAFKEALRYENENIEILLDYGSLKKGQGYWAEAERLFKRVIRIDPLNIDAYSHLVDLFKDNLNKLHDIRQELAQTDRLYNSPYSKVALGKLYLHLEDYFEAERMLLKAVEMDSSSYLIFKYLSEAYYELNNYEKFTQSYYSYLKKIDKKEEFDNLYWEVIDILSDSEAVEFESADLEGRKEFFLNLWKNKNPNQLSESNERLVEHIKRLKYARKQYTAFNKRGYDDRGRWYIKLGDPDAKWTEPMAKPAPYGGFVTQVPPNESWSYQSIDPNLTFDFEGNRAGNFKEVPYFAGETGRQMYQERMHLGGIYALLGVARDEENFETLAQQEVGMRHAAVTEMEIKIEHYVPKFNFKTELDYNIDICQFKGENGKTLTEIYYGLYNGKLTPEFDPETNYYVLKLNVDFLMRDSLNNEIIRDKFTQESRFRSEQALKESISVDKKDLILDKGKFEFYVQILEKNSNIGNVFLIPLKVRDFNFDTVMISDIQFSNNIRAARTRDKYVKNGINIFPYPFVEISRNRQLNVYYEIYNLTKNDKSRTDYEITYNVQIVKRNESLLKKIFGGGSDLKESISFSIRRSETESNTFETTAFDLSNLKFGEYKLTVTIKDFVSEKSTSISDNFILIE